MPNTAKLPICPYYRSERDRIITCENTYHTYSTAVLKDTWLDKYCVCKWECCPYAAELEKAYERYYKGDDKALMDNEIKALRKEMQNLSTKLGRSEKRVARQQKRIDELLAVNKSYFRENEDLIAQKKDMYAELRATREEIEKLKAHVYEDYMKMSKLYEDRLAYLMDTYCDGRLRESDVAKWADGKEYALTIDDEAWCGRVWKVITREEQQEGGETDGDEPEGLSEADRNEA